jgi:general secretion pathway protein G
MNERQSGFTLIELMVVVIIIAALAGMVLPRVIPAADDAKAKIALGDMANISVAVKLHRLETGTYPTALDAVGKHLEKRPVDPWGSDYRYRFVGEDNIPEFELWSVGADKREGTGDDVKFGK